MTAHPTSLGESVAAEPRRAGPVPFISIGILARNEEEAIGPMLDSLLQQSLFAELSERNLSCEILCVANGCTDNTVAVAKQILGAHSQRHPFRDRVSWQVLDVPARGKSNAWNLFVHTHASRSSQFFFLMDADIVIRRPATLSNMYRALQADPEAHVAVDEPIKDVSLKPGKSLRDRLSLAASRMTRAGGAQLTGQLYCMRAGTARRIYLPRDLLVEDGFIKVLVCTDFLTRPTRPGRIVKAEDAAHVFEAYTSIKDLFNNQKRQVMAQTITHILVDNHLKALPAYEKLRLADRVRELERADPRWLRRLVADHLRRTRHCWRLFPELLTARFKRLARLRGMHRLACLPAALAGSCLMLAGSWMARRALKQGCLDYWPDTRSPRLQELGLRRGQGSDAGVLTAAVRRSSRQGSP